MRILMGDSFEANIGKKYIVTDGDFDCGYNFDIIIGGKNPTFFENNIT